MTGSRNRCGRPRTDEPRARVSVSNLARQPIQSGRILSYHHTTSPRLVHQTPFSTSTARHRSGTSAAWPSRFPNEGRSFAAHLAVRRPPSQLLGHWRGPQRRWHQSLSCHLQKEHWLARLPLHRICWTLNPTRTACSAPHGRGLSGSDATGNSLTRPCSDRRLTQARFSSLYPANVSPTIINRARS